MTLGTLAVLFSLQWSRPELVKGWMGSKLPLLMAYYFLRSNAKMTENSKTLRDLIQSLRDTLKMGNQCTNVRGRIPGQPWRTSPGWSVIGLLGQSSETLLSPVPLYLLPHIPEPYSLSFQPFLLSSVLCPLS